MKWKGPIKPTHEQLTVYTKLVEHMQQNNHQDITLSANERDAVISLIQLLRNAVQDAPSSGGTRNQADLSPDGISLQEKLDVIMQQGWGLTISGPGSYTDEGLGPQSEGWQIWGHKTVNDEQFIGPALHTFASTFDDAVDRAYQQVLKGEIL